MRDRTRSAIAASNSTAVVAQTELQSMTRGMAPHGGDANGTSAVGFRIGAADGELLDGALSPGEVDLKHWRVHYSSTIRVGRKEYSGETLWDGARHYVRDSEDTGWTRMPDRSRRGSEAMPFGSPLWLLGALASEAIEVELISQGEDPDGPSALIRLSLAPERAEACSPFSLDFPSSPADMFPAQIWLDGRERICRMACTWPLGSSRRPWLRLGPFGRARRRG